VTLPARIEATARTGWARVRTDDGASWGFRVALALTVPVMYIVGRHQWFIRDDWAFIVTRNQIRLQFGTSDWLFLPTAGHWMTVPLLIYRLIEQTFGIDSYWPFLFVNMAIHVGIVLAVRALCRRVGVQPWTTTLVCAGLLVFGAGWENIVFAIQLTYGLSLLAFLLHLLLVDHPGPADRRDVVGAVVAVVGVMSSGFGPFFLMGVACLLILRRRWIPLAIATIPQAVALAWWWLAWGRDSPEPSTGGSAAQVPAYAVRGALAAFDGLIGVPGLAGIAAVAALGVALWRGSSWPAESLLLTLWITAAGMYVGLGTQRVAFGIDNAAISRYQYMGAMLLAPAFALAVDQVRKVSIEAAWVMRVVLLVALVLSLGSLRTNSSEWAIRARDEQHTLELIAGSGLADQADPSHQPLPFSPDVRVGTIAMLVEEGAVVPRGPTTPEEIASVRAALGLAP
jgi:hypothetical protein